MKKIHVSKVGKAIVIKGGAGSGHHGHRGRPGKVGGSQSGDGGEIYFDEGDLQHKPKGTPPSGEGYYLDEDTMEWKPRAEGFGGDTGVDADYGVVSAAEYIHKHELKYYDVMETGGWISEIENNIRMDPEEWEMYQANPAPYVADMMLDYGKGWPADFEDLSYESMREVAEQLALTMVSPRKKEYGQEVLKGGAGSGHHGHGGLDDVWGGSTPGPDKGGGEGGKPTPKKKATPSAVPKKKKKVKIYDILKKAIKPDAKKFVRFNSKDAIYNLGKGKSGIKYSKDDLVKFVGGPLGVENMITSAGAPHTLANAASVVWSAASDLLDVAIGVEGIDEVIEFDSSDVWDWLHYHFDK